MLRLERKRQQAFGRLVHYREQPPGDGLTGMVKAFWSLDADAGAPGWIEHVAVPDGCIEIVRRTEGRSRWGGDQPGCFAVGLIERPTAFEIAPGSRFAAVRLWPWTWPLLGPVPLAATSGRWIPIDSPDLLDLCARLGDPGAAEDWMAARLGGAPRELAARGRAIIAAGSVADMRRAAGMDARSLQRWFEHNVGVPPRRYLRMLRFQRAFAEAPGPTSLAEQAHAHGFADQAHMAREYRRLAGAPAQTARRTSKGPFLR